MKGIKRVSHYFDEDEHVMLYLSRIKDKMIL